VASLVRQRFQDERRFEIVIVDDGSTDSTPDVIRELAVQSPVPLRYVRVQHGGVAAARNAGVRHARGEWIAFFDDDQEAEEGWLSALVGRAEETGADCVAGLIRVVQIDLPHRRLDPTVLKLLGDNNFMATEATASQKPVSKVVPGTGNALARARLFKRVGLFNINLAYGEDAEWFRRARRKGAGIAFAQNAVIRHLIPSGRLTSSYLFSVAAQGAASRAMDDRKDGGIGAILKTSVLRLGHILLSLPRLALACSTGDHDATLGRACSIRYSLAYIRATVRALSVRQQPENPSADFATHR